LSCAASLAVQKVIQSENLLANCCAQGKYLSSLLRSRLQSPNAIAAPYTFDIRGGGYVIVLDIHLYANDVHHSLFWGIEFDFTSSEAAQLDFRGKSFAMLVQERCFDNGLVILGMTGGANVSNMCPYKFHFNNFDNRSKERRVTMPFFPLRIQSQKKR
jgi:4-aminobutyrate aminotransferase-like enzyme